MSEEVKPDLSRVKRKSVKELALKQEVKRRVDRHDLDRPKRIRHTEVASVSIPKHLKIRIQLEVGNGSFSRGVVKACIHYLAEVVDKERETHKRYK